MYFVKYNCQPLKIKLNVIEDMEIHVIAGIFGGAIVLITIAAIVTCIKCLKMYTSLLSEKCQKMTGTINYTYIYAYNVFLAIIHPCRT